MRGQGGLGAKTAAEAAADGAALAGRVALALCHDFAGPLGAITLGLDLLAEEVGELPESDARRLIGGGLRALDSRLAFARAAFAGPTDAADAVGAERAARALFAETKVELLWRVDTSTLPPRGGELLLLLAQLALSTLPRGGAVDVGVEDTPASLRVLLEAKGPFARLKPGTTEGLSGGPPQPGPAADWARAAYARAIAVAMGGNVHGHSGEGWTRVMADLPRDV